MTIRSKEEAPRRADRVGSFQAELDALEREDLFSLDEGQCTAIATYHHNLLAAGKQLKRTG